MASLGQVGVGRGGDRRAAAINLSGRGPGSDPACSSDHGGHFPEAAMCDFLKRNSVQIAAIKDVVTIISAPAALFSVFLAIHQLAVANSQLKVATSQIVTANSQLEIAGKQLALTSNSIRSSTTFQISHEGREIARELSRLAADDSNRPGIVLNFMYSLWHQHRLGIIEDDIWIPYTQELCAFMRRYELTRYWTAENQKLFAPEFVTFVNERGKEC